MSAWATSLFQSQRKTNPFAAAFLVWSLLALGTAADAQVAWVSKGLSGMYIQAMAIAPSNASVIYAAAIYGGGVFRSSDSGTTWVSVSSGEPSLGAVYALAVDPSNASVVYAGTYGSGLLKTTDGGQSWTALSLGSPNANIITSLAIDPGSPGTLYAGSGNGSVFRTSNGGSSWAEATLTTSNGSIGALAIDPNQTSTLYAAAETDGVYWSNDGGRTWQGGYFSVLSGPLGAQGVAIDPSNSSTLYCNDDQSVYVSTDRGQSWSHQFLIPATGATLLSGTLVVPGPPATLYVGSTIGPWVGTGGGSSWQRFYTGMGGGTAVYCLSTDVHSWNSLYAGTNNGVWSLALSGGGGHSVSGTITLNGVGLSGVRVTAGAKSATSDSNGNYVLAGLGDGTYTLQPKLFGYAFTPRTLTETVHGANITGANFVASPVSPPLIFGISPASNPFRLKITGSYFQADAKVFIGSDSSPWGSVVYKNAGLLIVKGGASLKARFPKGTNVLVTVVNGDGGWGVFMFAR